jgi:serpin B
MPSAGAETAAADSARAPDGPARQAAAVAAVQRLGGRIYDVLSGEDGNVAVSPPAAAAAIAVLVAGARSRTQGEAMSLMGVADGRRLAEDIGELIHLIARNVPHRSAPFVDLFGQVGIPWESAFLATLATTFEAPVHEVDFASDAESARSAVNQWMSDRTGSRIGAALAPSDLDRGTRLVLVSGISPELSWTTPFAPGATRPLPFRSASGPVLVPTMTAVLRARLGRGSGWRSVEIPLAAGGLALTVVLPEPGCIRRVEQAVSAGEMEPLLAAGPIVDVRVALPRWVTRTGVALQDAVWALGAQRVFGEAADLQGISREAPLRLDRLLHHVDVAVVEHGLGRAVPLRSVEEAAEGGGAVEGFRVDRPFLYLVHAMGHALPLALGRVVDPRRP